MGDLHSWCDQDLRNSSGSLAIFAAIGRVKQSCDYLVQSNHISYTRSIDWGVNIVFAQCIYGS